MRAKTGFLMR